MRLTRIEIENFKGVGTRQIIDLRPITLLFGPNSAGKSTILQALHYLREILERQNPDPDQTIAGGLIDLGGFAALVHNHEMDRAISIKLVIDINDEQGSDRLPINAGGFQDDPKFEFLRLRYILGENQELSGRAVVQQIGVGIEVNWSDLLDGPYVSAMRIDIDGEEVASIFSPPQEGRAHITDFNFAHPLLQQIVELDEQTDEDAHELLDIEEAGDEHEDDPFASPLGNEVWELSRLLSMPEAKIDYSRKIERDDAKNLTNFPVSVETIFGALPDFSRELAIDLIEIDELAIRDRHKTGTAVLRLSREGEESAANEIRSELNRRQGLAALLDELVLGPVRIARDFLGTMTYIGPLREIPARSFRPRQSPDESRWAQGLAAWDLLYTDAKGELFNTVNDWLSGENKLATSYRLEKALFREVPIPSRISTIFERGLTEDDIGELQELYDELETRTQIALRDFAKGILVAPSDVGVGISQMIPVIVGCLSERIGILAVEQPELHIHPAVQVGMGDLLIHATGLDSAGFSSGKSLLIETHSEHIMLRLLRRIRETSDGELPPDAPFLTPDALSVVYVETSDDGVSFKPLRIDKEGEFIDRWPKGFFDERAEELF